MQTQDFKLSESVENRQSIFFGIKVKFGDHYEKTADEKDINILDQKIENEMFTKLGVTDEIARFQKKTEKEIIYLFKTKTRKRLGEINKILNKMFQMYQTEVVSFKKTNFYQTIETYSKDKKYFQLLAKAIKNSYKGDDIKMFENSENWFGWQKELWKMVFDERNEIRPGDPRKIIYIYDKYGNTGKSSFIKYWLYNYEDITFLTYGSPQQLRSCITKEGERKAYIIDLPRTKSTHDSEFDLLNTIEQLKNGTILNTMFGDGKKLLFNPPTIVIFANYLCDFDLLSEDRWLIFTIDKETKTLVKLTEEECQKEYQKQIIQKEIEKKKIEKEIKQAMEDYFGKNQKTSLKKA